MLLRDKNTGDLIQVEELLDLMDPFKHIVFGKSQSGEEQQDLAPFVKEELVFPSGEELPRCWINASYRKCA